MKKGSAFIFGMLWLALFSAGVFIVGAIVDLGGAIVTGAVGIVLTYIGGNVADNWQRSKHYHPEMDKDRGHE
jgi:hypothetical protein